MVRSPTEPPEYTDEMGELTRLWHDCRNMTGGQRSRWIALPFNDSFPIIAFYRLSRAGYRRFGRKWVLFRTLTAPLNPFIRIFVPSMINYRADIGPGFRILHPQLGIVIGGEVKAGRGLILAGGNAIGGGAPVLGDWIHLGINASVMGSITLGKSVRLGAGAVAVKDYAGPGTIVGVPAQPVRREDEAALTATLDEVDFTV
ncbi:MAG: hypothetical protein ACTHN0_02420 [Aquihabitans sp.]